MYLVEVTDLERYELDLERVWVVDGTTRKLSRCAVQRSPQLDEQSEAYGGDVVLRIRCAALLDMRRPRTDALCCGGQHVRAVVTGLLRGFWHVGKYGLCFASSYGSNGVSHGWPGIRDQRSGFHKA